ncbi:GHKL domain-containing protein [Paenibacillus barcinonensis]|uniref:histidine kinase n=1 Tax=Paenibacillus barcinonensis TaxID=198119 RepID=A0A2V4V8F0_PAEBA|nr:ATP-binding protein [Paenibacillus barcinonensis]PYE48855.1 two-component system sensor histidine kinase YcbA [Paenibacillus barcinonensis]QKS57727.1 GHKL domain-containing protein [Paenibacillus barcinonensis]
MRNWVKNENVQMVAVALATAVGAQFKINPFREDYFRIGLGVSIFLFLLMIMPHLSYLKTGILTGLASLSFQSADLIHHVHTLSMLESLRDNLGAGLYYVVFAYGLSRLKHRFHEMPPLLLGSLITGIDFSSNLVELFVRGVLSGTNIFYMREWLYLFVVGGLRSYFVIGLYNSFAVRQIRLLHAEQEKRMEQMLSVNSGLYGEVFYLKKAMDTIEGITANSYELYRDLREQDMHEYSQRTLGIAQQIHEVKKDSQRILAGLLKLYDNENTVNMSLSEVLHFAGKANRKYSEMLHKQVKIEVEQRYEGESPYYIPLLTVLNNLLANAVESIEQEGLIRVQVFEQGEEVHFVVTDSGKGIPEAKRGVIFEPGYTTKFDEVGIAATGIGLSHVRDIVQALEGRIQVESAPVGQGTTFSVMIPAVNLMKEADVDDTFDRDRG